MIVQFWRFLPNLAQGDLGTSIRTGTPVTDLIAATLPVTLWLALYAIVLAVIIGVAGGALAAVYRGRWPEWVANGFSLAGLSRAALLARPAGDPLPLGRRSGCSPPRATCPSPRTRSARSTT